MFLIIISINYFGVEWDKVINKSFIDFGIIIVSCLWRVGMLGFCFVSRGVIVVNILYFEAVGSVFDRFMIWVIVFLGIVYVNFFFFLIWK